MPVVRYTADDFANQISQGVAARDKTIDTRIGTYRDIFIDPVSEGFQTQNERIYYLNQLMSLKNADLLVPDDVDDMVYNENVVRFQSTNSVTSVTFSRILAPTTDILIPIGFPISTKINPSTGTSILFKTIEESTMYAASASQYYNTTTGRYEIDVAIASVSQGSNTEVGAYTITEFRRPFPQFDEIFNRSATTDGRGLETNSELVKRYSLHVSGAQLSTPDGLKKGVLDNFNDVSDCYMVYGDNPYMERNEDDPGAMDCWVKGQSLLTRTYTTYYNGVYTLNSLDFQPLVEVTGVSSGGTDYTEGTDYEVVRDEGIYRYSNRSTAGIRWLSGGSHPAIGDAVVINYTYNSLMNQMDSFFKSSAFFYVGGDVLYREAQPKAITLELSLVIRSGSPANIVSSLRVALLNYVNSLGLGENVEEFDLDSIASKIYGIDNLTWTTLAVFGGTGVADIDVAPYEYPSLDTADLVINVA